MKLMNYTTNKTTSSSTHGKLTGNSWNSRGPLPRRTISSAYFAWRYSDISHKLYTGKNNPKGIIVKFISHNKKTQPYKERIEQKKVKLSDIFPGAPAAAIAKFKGIFINENLTFYRKNIMKKANEMRKDSLLVSAWSIDGKIFVKTSPEGRPIRIYCEDDLNLLWFPN